MFGFWLGLLEIGFGFCLDDWIFLVFLDCRFFGFSVIGLLDIFRKFIEKKRN
jgi:hypothetical protein